MKLKTLNDLMYEFGGIGLYDNLKKEAINNIKKINLFFTYQDKINELIIKHYKRKSQLQDDLKEVGKLEEYQSLKEKQDIILKELNLEREWGDFGNEIFLHITSIRDYIKWKFNVIGEDLK